MGHGEQLRLRTVRGQERPLVKLQPQQQLKAQDYRGHAEKLGVGTMKRAHERLLVKGQPSCSRRPTFWRCQSHRMPTTNSDSSGVGPAEARKPVCAAEGRAGKRPKAIGGVQRAVSGSQTLGILLFTLLGVLLCSDCACALVLPS